MTALLLLALALAMTACGSTSADEPKKGPAMDERPSMETIVSRYQAMQEDLFATLDQKVGQKPWAEAPNSSGFGRAGCPDDDEAEIAFLPDMSFTGTYDAGDWDEVKTLVEQVGREHGFDDTAVVADEPGNLDLVGEDELRRPLRVRDGEEHRLRAQDRLSPLGAEAVPVSPDAMTDPDPTAGARQVAQELARMVARASTRGDLPPGFVQQLLEAPDHDGALAILLEVGDGNDGTFAPDILEELAEGLITSAERVRRSRAVVPLLEALRRHPELAARSLARDDVLGAVVGGPRRPMLDRAVVRVLEAVAPLRPSATVAAVVRRLGEDDADLDRLARGVTALLLESFDDLAGLALGVDDWMPLRLDDLRSARRAGCARTRSSSAACPPAAPSTAAPGCWWRWSPIPILVDGLEQALGRSIALFELLAPGPDEPHERAAYLRVVTDLMRLTALQLLAGERPDLVSADVTDAWSCDAEGTRLPLGRLDRARIAEVVTSMDRHELLRVGA